MRGVPFVYRRRVRWGDGDPARIVYTVRFVDFAMEAIEEWFREVLGIDWYRLNVHHGTGTPVVHLELDFRSPVIPGEVLEIPVLVQRIGASSITFDLRARVVGGGEPFRGRVVHALIDSEEMRAIRFPGDYRARIEEYMRAGGSDEARGSTTTPP